MNMAKASNTDLNLALNITRIIDDLEQGYMSNPEDAKYLVHFDIDELDDCQRVIKAILAEAKKGSLLRVTFGMLVLCDPENTLLKPDSDILEPHPLISEMESDLQRETEAARYWNMRYHQVSAQLEEAQLSAPFNPDWDIKKAHRESMIEAGVIIENLESRVRVLTEQVELYRNKYQREHINTNRWKNRAELAEARIDSMNSQEPAFRLDYQYEEGNEDPDLGGDLVFSQLNGKQYPVGALFYAAPIPAQQSQVSPDGYMLVRSDVIDFLNGSGELIGCGFGEKPDEESGNYWWRRFLPDVNAKSSVVQQSPAVAVPDENAWIIEKLSYHKFERDDLSLDDCLKYLSNGWTEIHGRNERQFVLQILSLLAGQQPPRITEQAEDRQGPIIKETWLRTKTDHVIPIWDKSYSHGSTEPAVAVPDGSMINLLRSVWKHGFDSENYDDIDFCNQITIAQSDDSPRITEQHSKGIEYVKSCVLANSASSVREELLVILDEYIKLQQPKEKITYEICSLWRHGSDKFCIQFGDRSGLYVSEKILLTNDGATAIASAVKFYGLLQDPGKSEPSELVKDASAPYPHPRVSKEDAREIAYNFAVSLDPYGPINASFLANEWANGDGCSETLNKINCEKNLALAKSDKTPERKFVDLRQIVSDGGK